MSFHGEVRGGECHESRDQWTSNGGSSLCDDEEFAWCFRIRSSSMQVGATTQEKLTVLPFRVKIQGLALIGCAWQWPCYRNCFESGDFLQGENLRSMIGRRRRLCTVFFLEASLLENMNFRCCLGGVCAAATRTVTL
jgi:hypothetical protein